MDLERLSVLDLIRVHHAAVKKTRLVQIEVIHFSQFPALRSHLVQHASLELAVTEFGPVSGISLDAMDELILLHIIQYVAQIIPLFFGGVAKPLHAIADGMIVFFYDPAHPLAPPQQHGDPGRTHEQSRHHRNNDRERYAQKPGRLKDEGDKSHQKEKHGSADRQDRSTLFDAFFQALRHLLLGFRNTFVKLAARSLVTEVSPYHPELFFIHDAADLIHIVLGNVFRSKFGDRLRKVALHAAHRHVFASADGFKKSDRRFTHPLIVFRPNSLVVFRKLFDDPDEG